MNNKFSDIDKAIITAWLFFGTAVGAFVAPLFHGNPFGTGLIGLFAGVVVNYVLFFEPSRRRNDSASSNEQDNSVENEEEETDISEFIHDSFEAEGGVSEDDIEFKNEDDAIELNSDEETSESEESEENETDREEDIEESEDQTDDLDDELEIEETEIEEEENLEEDDLEEEASLPAFHRYENQIHSSSYDQYEDEQPQGLKAWLTPTRFPLTLAALWFFISKLISDNNPELAGTILPHFPASFFTIMPIFFLVGLSGLIGLLFREQDEALEMSAKENAAYLINLLKLLTGWGVGVYAILVNL